MNMRVYIVIFLGVMCILSFIKRFQSQTVWTQDPTLHRDCQFHVSRKRSSDHTHMCLCVCKFTWIPVYACVLLLTLPHKCTWKGVDIFFSHPLWLKQQSKLNSVVSTGNQYRRRNNLTRQIMLRSTITHFARRHDISQIIKNVISGKP